jgi:hypothetical protein
LPGIPHGAASGTPIRGIGAEFRLVDAAQQGSRQTCPSTGRKARLPKIPLDKREQRRIDFFGTLLLRPVTAALKYDRLAQRWDVMLQV